MKTPLDALPDLSSQQIRDKLDQDCQSAKILSEIVCSCYWSGVGVNLRELDRLDADNWALAKAIMEYRRQPEWDDEAFYNLAVWCRERHQLTHWTV